VSIAIDGDEAAGGGCPARQMRVEIETRRIGVDLEGGAGLRSLGEDRVPVKVASFSLLDESA